MKWQDGVASIRTFFSCDDVHGSSIWFNCQSDISQIIIFLNQYFAVFDIKTWNDPIYSEEILTCSSKWNSYLTTTYSLSWNRKLILHLEKIYSKNVFLCSLFQWSRWKVHSPDIRSCLNFFSFSCVSKGAKQCTHFSIARSLIQFLHPFTRTPRAVRLFFLITCAQLVAAR